MVRKALFRDSDGALLRHGYCDFTPQAGETVRAVPDDFPYLPMKARWTGTTVEEWTPPDPDPALTTRIQLDDQERLECKDDTAMVQVLNSTKADVEAWVAANFAGMTALNRARFAAFIWLGIQGARARLRR